MVAEPASPITPTTTSAAAPVGLRLVESQGDEPNLAYVPLRAHRGRWPIAGRARSRDHLPLPRDLVGEGELFLLKVVGDSMIDAAICDGDWVVVRQQPTADNGDIVAALLGDEATVKTFKNATVMFG